MTPALSAEPATAAEPSTRAGLEDNGDVEDTTTAAFSTTTTPHRLSHLTISSSVSEVARALYRGEWLAPMVRASTTPLRTLALSYGADGTYTEELVDRSVTQTQCIWNDRLRTIDYVRDTRGASAKTLRRLEREGGPPLLLRIDPAVETGRLIGQLGSGEPELAVPAAVRLYPHVDAIDLNMGCPKRFSVSGGMGSALLKDPQRACRILQALRQAMDQQHEQRPYRWRPPTSVNGNENNDESEPDPAPDQRSPKPAVPVSAKIRLLPGPAQVTVDFIAQLVRQGQASAVAVHGRRAGDDSVQPADWKTLEQVLKTTKAEFPDLPLLMNGDFYTRKEIYDIQQRTGADGVLLGRPALYNTSLFCKPPTTTTPSSSSDKQIVYSYRSPLLHPKPVVMVEYLRHAVRYDGHYKNIKYVQCEMMNNRRAPTPRVPWLPQEFPGKQTIAKVCACQSLQELCQVWNVDYNTMWHQVQPSVKQSSTESTFDKKNTTAAGGSAATLPAGEHKYDDAYLLQMESNPAETAVSTNTEIFAPAEAPPPLKRSRIETSS